MILKRVYIFLQILFLSVYVYGQYNVVQYKFIDQTGGRNEYNHFLLFNPSKLYYQIPAHRHYKSYADLYSDKEYAASDKYMISLKRDYILNAYYGAGYAMGRKLLIYYDNVPSFNWKIQNETEEILGYVCTKAIGEFRGRKYTVWFSKEIPYSIGPWKFNGLPGLILKTKDENNYFSYTAITIELNTNNKLISKFEKYYNDNINQAISYQRYIQEENMNGEMMRHRALSNLPRGTEISEIPPIRSLFEEKKFEWERN